MAEPIPEAWRKGMKTITGLKMRPFDVHIPNLDGDGIAETIRIEVPVCVDAESGEEILTPDAHELIEKTKARRMGVMLPDEIRELRQRLNLTQEQISALLQVGAKTYTRWESGRARPSRSALSVWNICAASAKGATGHRCFAAAFVKVSSSSVQAQVSPTRSRVSPLCSISRQWTGGERSRLNTGASLLPTAPQNTARSAGRSPISSRLLRAGLRPKPSDTA